MRSVWNFIKSVVLLVAEIVIGTFWTITIIVGVTVVIVVVMALFGNDGGINFIIDTTYRVLWER